MCVIFTDLLVVKTESFSSCGSITDESHPQHISGRSKRWRFVRCPVKHDERPVEATCVVDQ